jgi:hypothetical protein|tara:strand:- start:459 stop:731 length:273 start_codon:yes stop_codon:yes gene_type:complete
MPKTHLIICCNKNLRVNDWTPFENMDKFLINNMIVKKGDLISNVLDRLDMHDWNLTNSFSHKNFIYFVLLKKESTSGTPKNSPENKPREI